MKPGCSWQRRQRRASHDQPGRQHGVSASCGAPLVPCRTRAAACHGTLPARLLMQRAQPPPLRPRCVLPCLERPGCASPLIRSQPHSPSLLVRSHESTLPHAPPSNLFRFLLSMPLWCMQRHQQMLQQEGRKRNMGTTVSKDLVKRYRLLNEGTRLRKKPRSLGACSSADPLLASLPPAAADAGAACCCLRFRSALHCQRTAREEQGEREVLCKMFALGFCGHCRGALGRRAVPNFTGRYRSPYRVQQATRRLPQLQLLCPQ